jgi:hypothetical protein
MILTLGALSLTMPNPQYGYTVSLRMALRGRQMADGTIHHWDAGVANDARVLTLQWVLTGDEQTDWEFFMLSRNWRYATVGIALGASATGFYPGGPDHGDVGTFTGRLVSWGSSARLQEPYQRTTVDATILLETYPAYTLPALVSQGAHTIGTVGGFMAPQKGYKPGYRPAGQTDVTQGGAPSSVDSGVAGDSWSTAWEQECNHSHAAAIVNHLAAVARGAAFSVDTDDELRPFGDRGARDVVTARLSSGLVEISHDEHDWFVVKMDVQIHTLEEVI